MGEIVQLNKDQLQVHEKLLCINFGDAVGAMAWSPDSKLIAACGIGETNRQVVKGFHRLLEKLKYSRVRKKEGIWLGIHVLSKIFDRYLDNNLEASNTFFLFLNFLSRLRDESTRVNIINHIMFLTTRMFL